MKMNLSWGVAREALGMAVSLRSTAFTQAGWFLGCNLLQNDSELESQTPVSTAGFT